MKTTLTVIALSLFLVIHQLQVQSIQQMVQNVDYGAPHVKREVKVLKSMLKKCRFYLATLKYILGLLSPFKMNHVHLCQIII